jgi:hypothetical protein
VSSDPPSARLPSASSANADSDRALEIYKAVRAHEVALNEVRAALERGVLAPLITLNGGAVIAYLTLLGALSGKESGVTPNYWVAAGAIVAWGFGLVFAALAVAAGSKQQEGINKGYRLMREIVEARLDARIAAIVARDEQTEYERRLLRAGARTDADTAGSARKRWWTRSARAFVVGAAIALVSILVNASGKSESTTKTTTTRTTTSVTGKPATTTTTTTTTVTGSAATGTSK